MKEQKLSFNQAVAELESILKHIESGDIDLDDLTGKVKRASELIDLCNKKLKNTEEELEKIVRDIE